MRSDGGASCHDLARLFERLAPARRRLAARDDRLIAAQIALCEIPAPTGSETARGACVARLFSELALDVRSDEVGNVVGVREGDEDVEPVVVCAPLDTIFPDGTAITVERDGRQLSGPGIVDNSRGLAAMLAVAESIDGHSLRTRRPIVFAATVGEEGSGDLRGVRHLFESFDRAPASCIAVDGAGDERIVTRALGARRCRITYRGEGGHSWASCGGPNPVHAAGAAAARLASVPLPRTPRTTLSVCRIGGGISINAIPCDAWLEVDVRSSSPNVLNCCMAEVEAAARAALREENSRRASGTALLAFPIDVIGDRPGGELDIENPLLHAPIQAPTAI